jgi:predicted MFS family arabinose efflux permease
LFQSFGAASILGNIVAGKLLTKSAITTAILYPIMFGIVYLSFGNLGITIGIAVGGIFISGVRTQSVVFVGVLFLLLELL